VAFAARRCFSACGLFGLLALLVLVAAGCASGLSTRVPVVSVSDGAAPWSAWTYRNEDLGLCLEIRVAAVKPERLCGITRDNTGIWRPDPLPGQRHFFAGTTANASVASARVTLADGEVYATPVVPADPVTGLGFYVMTIGAPQPHQLELLGPDGSVLETVPID